MAVDNSLTIGYGLCEEICQEASGAWVPTNNYWWGILGHGVMVAIDQYKDETLHH